MCLSMLKSFRIERTDHNVTTNPATNQLDPAFEMPPAHPAFSAVRAFELRWPKRRLSCPSLQRFIRHPALIWLPR